MAAKKKGKRIRKAGTLEKLKKKLWQAITTAEEVLLDEESSASQKLRAVHAITQASNVYAKLFEASELERRLEKLEEEMEDQVPLLG